MHHQPKRNQELYKKATEKRRGKMRRNPLSADKELSRRMINGSDVVVELVSGNVKYNYTGKVEKKGYKVRIKDIKQTKHGPSPIRGKLVKIAYAQSVHVHKEIVEISTTDIGSVNYIYESARIHKTFDMAGIKYGRKRIVSMSGGEELPGGTGPIGIGD